jgi:peptidoglycan hydrolase CwlO-like protein
MVASSADMQAKIKKMNEDVSHIKTQLNRQGEIIKSSQGVTKINKEMMKYTEEKGRYTDNLLKMYSFLNIVAFGLLIYIYRAAN